MTNENELNDEFRGGNDHLISCMGALVQMNAENALTPHGIGSHASIMLSSAALRLESQQSRIDLLESAIREFLEISKTHYPDDLAYILSKQTLEILMGNE